MAECRLANEADVLGYYGRRPAATMRAYVLVDDGRVIAIAGLASWGRFHEFFSEVRPEARDRISRVHVLRNVYRVREWFKDCALPVYALASEDEPDAQRVIERLGFEHVPNAPEGLYKWPS